MMSGSGHRRVVVTGMGMLSPLGNSVSETWKNLLAGRSGIGPITRFDSTGFPVTFAGEVRGFEPSDWTDRKEVKKMDLFILYALAAAKMAFADSGLVVTDQNRDRMGVYVGSGIGGLSGIEHYHSALLEGGPRKVSPFFIPMVIINLASGQIGIHLNLAGPNSCAVSACATGTHCIGDAMHIIRRGDADVMLAGGTESAICDLTIAGFASSKALSTRNDDPVTASRPFDRDRDGFVLSEGAGVVVLEEYEHARKRGARIYGEVLGYGLTGDAYHITAPPEDANGAVRCMEMALNMAGIPKDQVTHINAHATSTFADKLETFAIKKVFGDHSKKLTVSATKSMTGHLLGGAGGIESIFCLMAINEKVVPPTMNIVNQDPDCDLDYVANEARQMPVRYALKNSFGFGGTNAALVFGSVDS